VGEHVGEVMPELLDRCRVRRGGFVAGELVEFVLAGFELVELEGQVTDAVAAGAFVEGAVLEGGQVAVDGRLGGGDLVGGGGEFGGVLVAAFGAEGLFGGDGSVDQVGAAEKLISACVTASSTRSASMRLASQPVGP
jgi:hypothetical protein